MRLWKRRGGIGYEELDVCGHDERIYMATILFSSVLHELYTLGLIIVNCCLMFR